MMAAELSWFEPGKILLTTYRDKVSAKELESSLEEIYRRLEAASAPVHVIVDWRKTTDYPYFINLFDPARKLMKQPRLGWIVIVGQNDVIELWIELFSRIADFRHKTARTVEQAAEI